MGHDQEQRQDPYRKYVKIILRFKEPKTGNAIHFLFYSNFIIAWPTSKGSVPVQALYTGLKGDVFKVPAMDADIGFSALRLSNSTADINDIPSEDFFFDMNDNNLDTLAHAVPTLNLMAHIFDVKKKFIGFLVNCNTEHSIDKLATISSKGNYTADYEVFDSDKTNISKGRHRRIKSNVALNVLLLPTSSNSYIARNLGS
ncbi:hypothetical protein BGZ51_001645 [Haplosporangium sp. Z 767]|nr:hypothetical protein BGZ51_001645 [Haplosporangium sp. Z 767]